ncbi:MAG TPA: hypothetical protein VG273_04140 [Bryobacteraceae bacterium]|nr:hypothetical protein [Bryobacteraceae bacterium]
MQGWSLIGEAEWNELHTALPDISDVTLRSAGLAIAQPWLGVIQHSEAELEKTLLDLAAVYAARSDLRGLCRQQVIAAKDRARWLSKSARIDGERQQIKAGMVEWMLVWLDDPAMFEAWIRARRARMA